MSEHHWRSNWTVNFVPGTRGSRALPFPSLPDRSSVPQPPPLDRFTNLHDLINQEYFSDPPFQVLKAQRRWWTRWYLVYLYTPINSSAPPKPWRIRTEHTASCWGNCTCQPRSFLYNQISWRSEVLSPLSSASFTSISCADVNHA